MTTHPRAPPQPVPATKASCDTLVCGTDFVLKSNAAALKCSGATCGTTDKARCCDSTSSASSVWTAVVTLICVVYFVFLFVMWQSRQARKVLRLQEEEWERQALRAVAAVSGHQPPTTDGPPTTDDHHHPRTTHQRQGIELDKGVPVRLTKALIDSLSVRTVGKQPKSASGSALEGADGAASMDDSQGYTRATETVCAICLGKI